MSMSLCDTCRLNDMMKTFPYINDEAEGCRQFNECSKKYFMDLAKKGYIDIESIPMKAEFCIDCEVTGNADPSWELSAIKTKQNCSHDKYTLG